MSVKKTITINKKWLEKEEKEIMRQIRKLIGEKENDSLPFRKESGYDWQLDCGNDWFAEIKKDKLTVVYRYGEEYLNRYFPTIKEFFSKPPQIA